MHCGRGACNEYRNIEIKSIFNILLIFDITFGIISCEIFETQEILQNCRIRLKIKIKTTILDSNFFIRNFVDYTVRAP